LRRDGEGDAALQCAHAAYFAALAIGAESGLCAGIMTDVVRVEADLDNLRAALSWLLATGDPDTALRIAASLTEYWTLAGGQFSEGRTWLERALARGTSTSPAACAGGCYGLATMLLHQDDLAASRGGAPCGKSDAAVRDRRGHRHGKRLHWARRSGPRHRQRPRGGHDAKRR
jgi:hypothetical protein